MPKKTKKEKIIAEYRRKLQAAAVNSPEAATKQPAKTQPGLPPATYQFSHFNPKPPTSPAVSVDQTGLSLIRRDLLKTLALTSIALAIEFILYWQFKS